MCVSDGQKQDSQKARPGVAHYICCEGQLCYPSLSVTHMLTFHRCTLSLLGAGTGGPVRRPDAQMAPTANLRADEQ